LLFKFTVIVGWLGLKGCYRMQALNF